MGEIENGKKVSALYLDIKKAFDTVNHSVLLQKLYDYGFRGQIYHWFSSYFQNRKQCVKLNGFISNYQNISNGVPQGSTLGPLLFLIYVNNLGNQNLYGSLYCFADDTALVYSSISTVGIMQKIMHDIAILRNWFRYRKIFPNLDKTKIISFNYRDANKTENIYWDGVLIQYVHNLKYLGLIIDGKLSWASHIESLRKKLRKLNYILYHASKFFTKYHLRRIYLVFVDPFLRFGLIHWGGGC